MEDPFKLLEMNKVSISPHIITILKSCGFISMNDLASFKPADIPNLKDDVRNVLGTDQYCAKLDEAAKLATFGPVFCNNPQGFKFLSGERKQLETISSKAGQLKGVNKNLILSLDNSLKSLVKKSATAGNFLDRFHNLKQFVH